MFDGVLLSSGYINKSRTCVKPTQNIKMNREIIEITELALANLLDEKLDPDLVTI